MIRYWIADLQICNACVAISDYQMQSVTGDVRRFVDMLDVPERLQQLHQSHAVCVVTLINVHVEIAADDAWTAVDRQTLKCC